jgi:DNA-binding MarR family transcriptional regulator
MQLAADLRIATGRLSRRLRRVGEPYLPPLQYAVLATLARTGPCTLAELAAAEGVSKPTMSRVVTALARRGFVLRETSDVDARKLRLSAAPEGVEALRGIARDADEVLGTRMRGLGPLDRDRLVTAIPLFEQLLAED